MNFAQLIESHPEQRLALIGRTGGTTFGQLRDQSSRLRGGLVAAGVGPGDRVGMIVGNNELFVVTLLAVVGAGAVAVPMNPASPAPELERELIAAEVVAVVAGPAGSRVLTQLDPALRATWRVVASSAEIDLDAVVPIVELLEHGAAPLVDVDPDDPAVVLFTSGTAGPPRGALLSHENLLVNQQQVLAADPAAVLPDDVVLAVLPLFHVYGLNVVLGLGLRAGATLVLEERFDAERTLEVLATHSVTVVAAGPPVWVAWSETEGSLPALSALRRARSGAAALSDVVARKMVERHGVSVSEGYGLTEASPVVSIAHGDEVRRGSVGQPLPGLEVRLVDEEGSDALVGDPGEVWVRGPNVFPGYLDGGPTAVDDHGWLHTGDIAVADDDGWLYLVDRIKDLILVSGFNVYPAEVEAVLAEHPQVDAAVVLGAPDPATGERIVAHVVVGAGEVFEEQDLIDFATARLPRFKVPARIDVHDALPVGLAGKTPRRLLRDQ